MSGISTDASPLQKSTAVATTTAAATKSQESQTRLNQTFDQFLNMLTIQLTNQDPTNPMDTHKMTQQLVAFSGVEQQIRTNSLLEEELKLQQMSLADGPLAYIGRKVEYEQNDFPYVSGNQTNLDFTLEQQARLVEIEILDDSGTRVRFDTLKPDSVDGSTIKSGLKSYSWDGKSTAGQDLPSGKYAIKISAYDTLGRPIENTNARASGTVVAVDTSGAEPVLELGEFDKDGNAATFLRLTAKEVSRVSM
jgi:flagellar basal-body rod modification protein FlgD